MAVYWRRPLGCPPAAPWRDQLHGALVGLGWSAKESDEAIELVAAELRALGVSYDRPGAAWEHGLSLGRFSSEERAQAALKDLARQGIRTARVVQERTESKVYTLRLPAVDRALQSQLPSLRRALAGKRLQPCD